MFRVLSYFLVIVFAVLTACQLPAAVSGIKAGWQIYLPLLYGVGANFILSRISLFSRNQDHLRTLSHELTHWLVGLMLFKKIHSLNVEEDTGSVVHSGGRFGQMFLSLSPYCFPIFTVILLLLRFIIAKEYLFGFDIAVGMTLGFHIGCFMSQIGSHQSDITKYGLFRSYVYIAALWMFFFLVILFSVRYDLFYAVKDIFVGYWDTLNVFWDFCADLVDKIAKWLKN